MLCAAEEVHVLSTYIYIYITNICIYITNFKISQP